ncbi:hypothetical protein BTVI_93109 [Pitangus sulphuratus]|nr:hypothetical protein BTVI_93109 [Pitangus sulphuratus]
MRPDKMYPIVLRELADMVAKTLSMIFEKSWQSGEVLHDQKKGNLAPIFESGGMSEPGNYRTVSFVPGKIMEQILLQTVLRHTEDREMVQDCQRGFTKGKSCLTSFTVFQEGVTTSVNKGRAMGVIYMDFCKSPTTSFFLNWREMDLSDGVFSG